MATSSRSIGQKCSRSPRLKTGSIAFTRATNASRTSSVTRRPSPLPDFPVWSEPARLMKWDGLPEAGGGLNGKVVVVTGGTGYLGSSVSKAFAEAGATVVAVYLLDREIPYFEKVLGALGKNVTLLKANVPEAGEMDRVAKEILTRLKRIDVLVNTVGGYRRRDVLGGLRSGNRVESQVRVPRVQGGRPIDASSEGRRDRECLERGGPSGRRGILPVLREQVRREPPDGELGARAQVRERAGELRHAADQGHAVEPRGDAEGELLEMGEDGSGRARGPLVVLGRCRPDHRRSDSGLRRSLTGAFGLRASEHHDPLAERLEGRFHLVSRR